jgi:hypothetical protein
MKEYTMFGFDVGTFGLDSIPFPPRESSTVCASLRKWNDRFPGSEAPCYDLMLEHLVKILSNFLRGRAVQSALTHEIERSFSREGVPFLDLNDRMYDVS